MSLFGFCWAAITVLFSQKDPTGTCVSVFLRSAERAVMDVENTDCPAAEYLVKRKVLDELRLDEVAKRKTWSNKPPLGEQVKESLR